MTITAMPRKPPKGYEKAEAYCTPHQPVYGIVNSGNVSPLRYQCQHNRQSKYIPQAGTPEPISVGNIHATVENKLKRKNKEPGTPYINARFVKNYTSLQSRQLAADFFRLFQILWPAISPGVLLLLHIKHSRLKLIIVRILPCITGVEDFRLPSQNNLRELLEWPQHGLDVEMLHSLLIEIHGVEERRGQFLRKYGRRIKIVNII